MKQLLPMLVVVASILAIDSVLWAFPKPSINPVAWELSFEHGTPTRITVRAPGEAAPRAYWYMTFVVTNKTRTEQDFLPVIDLVDDRGNIHRSDTDIPKAVFEAVKDRERNRHLRPLGEVSGRLLEGEDQARHSVAIWREPLERMGSFQIFIGGLSGEAVWFKDGKEVPMKEADWNKPEQSEILRKGQILRKTLEIDYQVPGDEQYQGRDRVVFKKEEWVMR